MKILFSILHIAVCIALVGVIMMQSRKSGGFSGAFGGGGTQMDNSGTWQRMTSFTKVTSGLLIAFMLLSIIQVMIK
ncbi:preprotein translocase subunit SecG [Synergistaceae bacterium OttesenSCG-928-D05]|nr:preprotein translocase subunit SecG [Synergistaceae bacterium OttesenSCG-928-D05]